MDNIQKLIVGSLGLVGLIVILVPNSDPLASQNVESGQATAASEAPPPPPPLPPPLPSSGNNENAPAGFVVDDSDIANFGKPMVDPTPPGQRNQQVTQEQIQPTQQPFNDGGMQSQGSPGNIGQQLVTGQNSVPAASLQPPT